MNKSGRIIAKSVFFLYFLFLHFVLIIFVYEKLEKSYSFTPIIDDSTVQDPLAGKPLITPLPLPTFSEPSVVDTSVNTSENTNLSFTPESEVSADVLMIPVVGVKREQILDTYNDARNEDRMHNAIDIPAPPGTPVVAVSDGEIAKFFDSERGGITIYQYSPDRSYAYYYAHLQRRAENIKEKEFVKRGTVIGYVGDTGNAGEGNYHLHFGVTLLADPDRYFEGTDINPYPLLQNAIEAR